MLESWDAAGRDEWGVDAAFSPALYWSYRLAGWALLHLGEDAASLAFLFC
ncbi:hypothetical protein PSQ39_12260 [Curvibacter sp. HBC28]|uniref:Uncharacterized protein n=1 Tax=Curvibacter microcysteis TaxID=3026419 RepID=A0ABT5MFQ0_9BURK|nr:hypothetical protein [Curvibacter sp. HBC28]MDD0815403.1 hypothetical protein [Curvibacter sp. HBC28]